ncbi:hypothetical protein [Micromonospora sp. MH33]|uniref:hypothetical protein n=1 Tax=Micromonospora sp. MH33 TaxID=1945509 RepID=UPI000D14A2EE|nr:hypothetical protein [Micromonospora sp. MH33]
MQNELRSEPDRGVVGGSQHLHLVEEQRVVEVADQAGVRPVLAPVWSPQRRKDQLSDLRLDVLRDTAAI